MKALHLQDFLRQFCSHEGNLNENPIPPQLPENTAKSKIFISTKVAMMWIWAK
jgi:hypothetical protein